MSNNRTLGAVALLMAVTLIVFGWGLVAPFAYEPVGPRAFPLLTAILIGGCGIVLMVQGGGRAEPISRPTLTGLLMLTATLLGYALLFERLGYVPATALMSAIIARIFGASAVQAVAAALILAVGSFLIFDHGLDVVLPTGILGGLI